MRQHFRPSVGDSDFCWYRLLTYLGLIVTGVQATLAEVRCTSNSCCTTDARGEIHTADVLVRQRYIGAFSIRP